MSAERSGWALQIEATMVATIMLAGVLLQLAGCTSTAEVSPADRDAAEAFVHKDLAPRSAKQVAMWYASADSDGMVCGEIEAPPALKAKHATLRYVFDARNGVQQIEMHELWVGRGILGQAAIEANRTAFDSLWSQFCQPYAPLPRRIGHWFGA